MGLGVRVPIGRLLQDFIFYLLISGGLPIMPHEIEIFGLSLSSDFNMPSSLLVGEWANNKFINKFLPHFNEFAEPAAIRRNLNCAIRYN